MSRTTRHTSNRMRLASLLLVGTAALFAAGCGGGGVYEEEVYYGEVDLLNIAGPGMWIEDFYMHSWTFGDSTGNLLFEPLPDATVETVATMEEDTYDADSLVYDDIFDVTTEVIFPPDDVIGGLVTTFTVESF